VDESWVRQAAKGAGISGLNPKVFLLFLALLPQFIDAAADWPLAAQVVSLGLVHVASCALVCTGVGAGARLVLRARPTAAQAVTRFSGAAMVLVGVMLLGAQLVGNESSNDLRSMLGHPVELIDRNVGCVRVKSPPKHGHGIVVGAEQQHALQDVCIPGADKLVPVRFPYQESGGIDRRLVQPSDPQSSSVVR
jgi:hypothetical protein